MTKFILLSFVLLAAAFYEASGGAGFDPEATRVAAVEARQERDAARRAQAPKLAPELEPATEPPVVARAQPRPQTEETAQPVLQLVTFGAAAKSVSDPPQAPAPVAPAPLADLAGSALENEAPLTLSALETPAPQNSTAFAGSRTVASSQNAVRGQDIRAIKGTLVNLRSGPGTDYDVIDQLSQNTAVEVLTDTGNGWVELRPVEGGATGWIAAFLLTRG